MFGREKKKQAVPEWEFDLEKQMSNVTEQRSFRLKTDERIQKLKSLLRQGTEKQAFDDAQTLLHGYLAAQKVLARIAKH